MFERSIIEPRRKTRAIFHFNHTHKRHKHRELISKSTKFEIESHARRVSRAIGIKHQVKILLRVEEQRQRHSSTRARIEKIETASSRHPGDRALRKSSRKSS